MKLAISGTHCTGKSTFIKDFLKNWPTYETPKDSYRTVIKKKKLPHSKGGTEESQRIILDALCEQLQSYSKSDNVIFDRCVLDNLAYSAWLNLNGKVSDKFLDECRIIVREALKMLDIVFFIPLTKIAPVTFEKDELREEDLVYREEIDNIFKVFVQSYQQADGRIFDAMDAPPIIEIFGSPEERIKLMELYLDKDGKAFGEEKSLISDISLEEVANAGEDKRIITDLYD
jgi:predicted ATPase